MTLDAKAIFNQRRQQRETTTAPEARSEAAPSVPAAKDSPFSPEGAAAIYEQRR
ncbi:hypothetical protein [Bradyrhizobium elkanii]|uniref:hypothetical protein n=1 Tax=Bradyrhizobium elkanii TaxID=29448 RepID=UPI0020A076A3|nr:hypothetical protein [Bradyrhizobium elkanii]MCP1969778.1 hypothetical protein [Bradyrhizobium elkanii]MCS4108714.1 hypothetical protein [Bradyrhizobium elkanii]